MDVELVGLALVLIVVLAADSVACAIPIPYIKTEFERLHCSATHMKIIPTVKVLAVAGLIFGLWVPWIGALACIGMLIYFGFAFWFHYQANDPVAKYLPAIGFALLIAAALFLSYIPAA